MPKPYQPRPGNAQSAPPTSPKDPVQSLAPEDFYYEGPYLVFTEVYHLKRGYCCNSDCRHCPYRHEDTPQAEGL